MSRQRKQTYRSTELAELTRQLMYSPPEKRAEAVLRAERLHDDLEADKTYPIDFVVYRLTDRRVPQNDNVMLVGEAIRPDLRLLIDALSRSIELPCDASDPGRTTNELAEHLGVSTKTIARWRDQGLRWRWGVSGGKSAVLITQSAIDAFEQQHADRVSSARGFSRLSDDERTSLLKRARRLTNAADSPPQAIFSHLAKRTGRSVEALRLLIQQHDKEHPDEAVFANRTGPLTGKQKRAIDQAYQEGVTVSALCERYNKTRSTIYRAIHEGRAACIDAMELTAIPSPIFDREDADEVLNQPLARKEPARQLDKVVIESLPDQLKAIYGRPIEPDEVLRSLIVRYNYLKYRAINVQTTIRNSAPRAAELNEFDRLLTKISRARGEVLTAVLPVALSITRRQLNGAKRDSLAALAPLLWMAHRVLIEQIDCYDPAVAHSFESVLANHLLRSLARPDAPSNIGESDLIRQLRDAGLPHK